LPKNAVDLGLANDTLWAVQNVGASSDRSPGLYYQWGDTEGTELPIIWDETSYDESKYKFFSWDWRDGHSFTTLSKYTWDDESYKWDSGHYYSWYDYSDDGNKFIGDNLTILDPEDDAVTQAMGGKWRTPTISDYLELLNGTTWVNNLNIGSTHVQQFVGKNRNDIIFYPGENQEGYGKSPFILWTSNLKLSIDTIPESYSPPIYDPRYMNSWWAIAFEITQEDFVLNQPQTQRIIITPVHRYYSHNIRGVYPCNIDDSIL